MILFNVGVVLKQEGDANSHSAIAIQEKKYNGAVLAPLNLTIQAVTGVQIFLASSLVDRIFFVSLDENSSLTINDLGLYFGNETNGYGGAIASQGTVNLNRCTFEKNKAQNGAALACLSGTMNVTNCTIAGNLASSGGGGIYVRGQLNLINTTVANNSAVFGGGVYVDNSALLVNTIVANNTASSYAPNLVGNYVDSSSHNNLINSSSSQSDYTGGMTNAVNGNIVGVNPRIQTYFSSDSYDATRTLALLTGSPAINAGSVVSGVTTDLRGIARPQGTAPDIGSYEARLPVPVVATSILNHLSTDLPCDLLQATSSSPAGGVFIGAGVSGNYFYPANAALGANAVSYSLTSADNITLSVPITIYITQTPFVSWRARQGLPANGSLDFANPSGDGIVNLVKYAFNLAPNAGDLNHSNLTILPENGSAGLPFYGIDSSSRLTIEFIRRKASTNPGVAYIVQVSSDLATWSALDLSSASIVSIDNTFERVTVTDPTVASKRFGRVGLEALPIYSNDFNSALGAITLRGSAAWLNQGLQLTDEQNSGEAGAVIFNSIPIGPEVTGFNASFTVGLGFSTTNVPADGLSFAVGDLGSGAWGEGGPGTAHSLAIGFDTCDNSVNPNDPSSKGVHVWLNGNHVAYYRSEPYTNGVAVPVTISYDPASGLTVTYNGVTIFNHLSLASFKFQNTDLFGIGARTGGFNERAVIDDVQIAPR